MIELEAMNSPAKNRLHDYEAGWLTLLLKMGVAEEKDLYAAQTRKAKAAIKNNVRATGKKTGGAGAAERVG